MTWIKNPLGFPPVQTDVFDSRLVINFYLESPRLTFNLLANLAVNRDIRNWRLLKIAAFNLAFTKSLGDHLPI